jgi:hypothetical protein
MAGYSGTPLHKKLGIKSDSRVLLIGMPPGVKAGLKKELAACTMLKDGAGALDFVHLFTASKADLQEQFSRYAGQLAPAGILWVSWPKKASGVATDLTEDRIREIGLAAGLVDVKVCAVDETWSGLKFVIPLKDRKLGASPKRGVRA